MAAHPRRIMASLGLSLALAAVVALTRHQAAGAGGALRLDETSGPSMPSYSSDEWRIEKYTINILSTQGTAMSTHEWISQYLCTPKTTCPSDLGCGNMRVWCTIGSPYSALEFMNNTFELHWVSAPTLQDLTVGESKTRATDAWIGYLEELNGDDMRFSAFSHKAPPVRLERRADARGVVDRRERDAVALLEPPRRAEAQHRVRVPHERVGQPGRLLLDVALRRGLVARRLHRAAAFRSVKAALVDAARVALRRLSAALAALLLEAVEAICGSDLTAAAQRCSSHHTFFSSTPRLHRFNVCLNRRLTAYGLDLGYLIAIERASMRLGHAQ